MNISAKEICFGQTQTQHLLSIRSVSNSTIIFKIKITNTELFTIVPGKGFLKANNHLQIQIKINKNKLTEISAKLLISYSVLTNDVDVGNGFDKIWNGFCKDRITNEIIPIKREVVRQKVDMYKKTDSPVYQAEVDSQNVPDIKQQCKNQPIANVSQLMGSMKSSSALFKSIKDFDRCNSVTNAQTVISPQLEKQLQKQRQKSKRLKYELEQKERKMEYYRDMNQQHINKSFRKQQKVEGIDWVNIVLIIFVCLMIGFFAAKFKLPGETI